MRAKLASPGFHARVSSERRGCCAFLYAESGNYARHARHAPCWRELEGLAPATGRGTAFDAEEFHLQNGAFLPGSCSEGSRA